MEDVEQFFLQALGKTKRQLGNLPNFLVKGDPPNKIRLGFRSKIEPPMTLGEYTIITVTPQDFAKIVQMYPQVWADMTKKK